MMKIIKLFFYKTSWNISYDKKSFEKVFLDGYVELKNNLVIKNAADPFPFIYQDKKYFMYEKINNFINKGRIELYSFENKKNEKFLKKSFNLSFPIIFKSENKYIFTCEMSEKNIFKIFKIENKINNITEFGVIKSKLIDPVIKEIGGNYYIISCIRIEEQDYEPVIFCSKDLKNWNRVDRNNIEIAKGAERNAGYIMQYNDSFYRFSQINKPNYGSGIMVSKITNISNNSYSEELIKEIKLNSDLNNINGFHTINFIGDQCFFDYRIENFNFFAIFYKIFGILRKKINNL